MAYFADLSPPFKTMAVQDMSIFVTLRY